MTPGNWDRPGEPGYAADVVLRRNVASLAHHFRRPGETLHDAMLRVCRGHVPSVRVSDPRVPPDPLGRHH